MTEIMELLSQINENPRLLAKIDIVDETGVFDKDRMRAIIAGLKNEKLIDAFIRLTVNKWNSLEARKDYRLYEVDNNFNERLKFTGEEYFDLQGNRHEDSIDNYLDILKCDDLRARDLEAKELKEQEEILYELGLLDEEDCQADTNASTSEEPQRYFEAASKKLATIASLLADAQEREALLLENRTTATSLLKTLTQSIQTECKSLADENAALHSRVDELTEKLKAATDELNELLNPEPIELTEEEIAEYEQQEREFREYEKLQFDKALKEAIDELEKKSVKITTLTKRVLDIPEYDKQLEHFRVLSFLLAGVKAWQQVEGSLVDQINSIANERRQQPSGKLADQLNILTGKDAQANYTSPTETDKKE